MMAWGFPDSAEEANARLIAAAPELLEQLKACAVALSAAIIALEDSDYDPREIELEGCDSDPLLDLPAIKAQAEAAILQCGANLNDRAEESTPRGFEPRTCCSGGSRSIQAERAKVAALREGLEELQEIAADWSVDLQGRTVEGMTERQKAVHACVRVIRSVTQKALDSALARAGEGK